MSVSENLGPTIRDGHEISRYISTDQYNLKVGHCNIQSMKPSPYSVKFNEFEHVLSSSSFDIFGITETWLKPYVPDGAVAIPNYNFCRNDRILGRGGGVGIYISHSMQYKVLDVESQYGECEVLFMEIFVGDLTVLFGVVYLPHGNINAFESTMGDFFEKYDKIIVVGDFNCNLLNPIKSGKFRSLCSRLNISIHHNLVPTHFDLQHGTTSLLDYFIISDPSFLNKTGQVQCPLLSHHALIYACFNFHCIPSTSTSIEYVEYRDYSRINMDELQSCISRYDFSTFYNTSNVDDQLYSLNMLIAKMFSLVPISKFKLNRNTSERIKSRKILYAKSLRDIAY